MKTMVIAAVAIFALSVGILPAVFSPAHAGANPEATRMQQTGSYGQ